MEYKPINIQPNINITKTNGTAPASVCSAKPYAQNPANSAIPADKVCWASDDGQVVIRQLVLQAHRHPVSDYPCVVIQGFPKPHERVRSIPGGGIELMLTGQECEEFIEAMNAASLTAGTGKLFEILKRTPPKTQERKQHWKSFNEKRLARHRGWWQNKRRYRP